MTKLTIDVEARKMATNVLDVKNSVARPRPLRIIATVLILCGLFVTIRFLIVTDQFEWPVVAEYLFSGPVMTGLGVTLGLACLTHAIGSVLGVLFALARMSDFAPIKWVGTAYVTIFRSVPALVQLIFWFNIAYLIPNITIAIPFGPDVATWDTNTIVTPVVAAVVGLSLPQGAYMTEIVRGSIMAVPDGQRDAARALGYSPFQSFMKITLPQAVRVALPPTGSQFISVVHATALVSVIAVGDLLFSVQNVYERTYQVVPLLMVAVIWYVVLTLVLTYFQGLLEKRFGRGYARPTRAKRFREPRNEGA